MNTGIINWENYWSGVSTLGAYSSGGVNHPSIDSFWQTFLAQISEKVLNSPRSDVLDVCAGNGALTAKLVDHLQENRAKIFAVDYSESAIEQIKLGLPRVVGRVADVSSLPFNDSCFGLLVSQFGVEYANESVYSEILRVVDDNGTVALMIHAKESVIDIESSINISVIDALLSSEIIEVARSTFSAGVVAMTDGDKKEFDTLSQQFAHKVKILEEMMRTYGKDVAGGFLLKFYNDLADVYENLNAYDLKELKDWLTLLTEELHFYRNHMNAMCKAALDANEFNKLVEHFKRADCNVDIADKLFSPNQPDPLAWILVVHKQ